MYKLGLVINPFAGIGGRVGLKGSDGDDIREQALSLGAKKLANQKALNCFKQFESDYSKIEVFTVSGEMGETLCQELAIKHQVLVQASNPSSDTDTKKAVEVLQSIELDLLLFVGGDGTARNIFEVYNEQQTVLGIPAGVKIHSGVYAISAEAAGLLTNDLINGKMLSLVEADVVDLDEDAFRKGKVKARKFGYLQIPASLQYIQAVKHGNVEIEDLVLDDIAAEIIESMDDDTYYVIGSGTTCAAIMRKLNCDNTLLGSDILFKEKLVASDAVEKDLLNLIKQCELNNKKVEFVLTVIGGQGHILGRGNHQISPNVIKQIGWKHIKIISTKSKLNALNGRPLLVDTGDLELDHQLSGSKKVITGYRDYVLYPVA